LQKSTRRLYLDLLTWTIVFALSIAGIWMRLHFLNVPFDRDSFDEGVYWQSLRSMSTGASLYQQIFYSQPPFFLLSIYPFYTLLGQTIWAARLGIATISLFGFLGALLLGKALAGRLGMILALLLLVASPVYLAGSQILQADAPSTGLTLLAVGLAYLWWKRPDGSVGYLLATLTGIVLALSILIKLLALPALIPISILACAHLWIERRQAVRPLLFGCAAFILTAILLFLPFIHAFPQLWQTVVSFHTAAKGDYLEIRRERNADLIRSALMTPLFLCALYGIFAALVRRDWRVIPLLAWFVATIFLLWEQAPLMPHHLIAVISPLVALSVIGISPRLTMKKRYGSINTIITAIAIIIMLWQSIVNLQTIQASYTNLRNMSNPIVMQHDMGVVRDLEHFTRPGQLVITDAQFIVAMADRSTPANLVDTSFVRINSQYITTQQLITEASSTKIDAVLFYTHRLETMKPSFYSWVQQHFHLVRSYGDKTGLWIKN